jgi:ATP-dependent helicase/nuclease subunit B
VFEDHPASPRIFAQPIGTDFPRAVVDGLRGRMAERPPEAMARVTLVVNTTRMWRRIRTLFAEGPAGFLPRMLLVTDLGPLLDEPPPAPARSPLQRRLQLAQIIAPAVDKLPEFAPRASVFALADSLARLMDEMQGEGVDPRHDRRVGRVGSVRPLGLREISDRYLA